MAKYRREGGERRAYCVTIAATVTKSDTYMTSTVGWPDKCNDRLRECDNDTRGVGVQSSAVSIPEKKEL